MKAIEFKAAGRQKFRVRRVARTAKDAGRSKTCVVDQDNQNIRCSLGWAQLGDRWEFGVRILRVIGNQPCARAIRDGENCSLNVVWFIHEYGPFFLNQQYFSDVEEAL